MLNVDWLNNDTLGVFLGDLLDFHTTILWGNDSWFLAVSIKNEGKVKLSDDINTFMDEDGVHKKSLLRGLMSN